MQSRSLDYERHYRISGELSDVIVARRIPEPSKIAEVLGESAVLHYYLMHALFHALEHRKGTALIEPIRIDKKPLQKHSFDSAVKPSFRYFDDTPSNYDVNQRETNSILVHDPGEDVGKSILGALVINDMIRYILGETTGKDASTLTNYYALAMHAVYDRINKLNKINSRSVSDALSSEREKIDYKKSDIARESRRVVSALQNFMLQPIDNCEYMPKDERRLLVEIMTLLSSKSVNYLDERLLTEKAAVRFAQEKYEDIIGILKGRKYLYADKDLLLPEENHFLATLNKTLYRHFVRGIAAESRREALAYARRRNATGDGYLSPFIEKIAESTDNAANMEYNPPDKATSIHRKARIVINIGAELAEFLDERGMDYSRLQNANYYLFRILKKSIRGNINALREKIKDLDTTWKGDLERFELMLEKTEDLEKKVINAERQMPARELEEAVPV